MTNQGNPQRLTPRGSTPDREFLADTRMNAIMRERGINRRSNSFVKLSVCFTTGKTVPSVLQSTTCRVREVGVHFGLSQIAERRHTNFFEFVRDLWREFESCR